MMECGVGTILVVTVLLASTGLHCHAEQRYRKVIAKSVAFKVADHEYGVGEAILATCSRTSSNAYGQHDKEHIQSPIKCPEFIRNVEISENDNGITEQEGTIDKGKGTDKRNDTAKHVNKLEHILKNKQKPHTAADQTRQTKTGNKGVDELARKPTKPTKLAQLPERVRTRNKSTANANYDIENVGTTTATPRSSSVHHDHHASETMSTNKTVPKGDSVAVPPISTYIVGGTLGRKERKPWQASIQFVGTDNCWHHFCGAALVDRQWIVTAAHCVADLDNYTIQVVLGDYILGSLSGREQYVDPARILYHGYYNPNSFEHDIAVVQLADLVEFNDNVYSITMADHSESFGSTDVCYITGWGVTDGSTNVGSNILRESEMTVITELECKQNYGNVVTDNQLCVVSQDASACRGDSGGALVCRDGMNGWVQAGVASYIISPECAPSSPSTYTRVSSYSKWIETVIVGD